MKNKIVVWVTLCLIVLGLYGANVRAENAELKALALEKKIDYRYMSYDSRFMFKNTVVIDEDGEIVGKLVLYTNDEEIEGFFDNPKWRKTRLYHDLKDRKLNFLEKE